MQVSVLNSLDEIAASDWNTLAGDANPFLRHEFLHALETTGCVCAKTGWQPRHLAIHSDDTRRGRLLGAAPLYLKNHSYGEYVFDWAWANAYARAGLSYYPKLVASVPFTPATGPRLLTLPGTDTATIKKRLVQGALDLMERNAASSLHWLFLTEDDACQLEADNHLMRTGYQFHWTNAGYRDFGDFLSTFTAQKRKKIKRERRYVHEAGIAMEALSGDAVTSAHWDVFYEFYHSTIRQHGAIPYLTREFFHRLGETMREQVVLIFARRGAEYVAGALNLRGADTLYGRYWGGRGEFHSLHFETCYYSAIEYCIEHGFKRFEAGAQGGHKLARGFAPVVTRSAHLLVHPQFNRAVADYLERERIDVASTMNELNEHVPFKKGLMAES